MTRITTDDLYNSLVMAVADSGESTILPAIRVDLFFHLSLKWSRPLRYWARNIFYPLWMIAVPFRARISASGWGTLRGSQAIFVIQYAAAAGYGTLAPLLDVLRSRGSRTLVVVTNDVYRKRRRDLRVSRSDAVVNADAWILGSLFSKIWPDILTAIACYRRLVASCGDPRVRGEIRRSRLVVVSMLFRALSYRRFATHLVEASGQVRAIVSHNDFMPLNWEIADIGRELRIPEYTLQHGSPSLEYFPTSSKNYVVWGEAARRYFQDRGTQATSLHVWGCPRMDVFWRERNSLQADQAAELIRRALPHISKKARIIVFISHTQSPAPGFDYHAVTLSHIRQLSLALPSDVGLVIKLHPQETLAAYRRVFPSTELAHLTFVRDEIHHYTLLKGATLVVSPFSTMLIEAMLLDVPVVQVNFPRASGLPDYSRAAGGIYAETVQDVLKALDRLSVPSRANRVLRRQREFCTDYFANLGCASEAVTGRIFGGC